MNKKRAQRNKEVAATVAKLKAKILRDINKRLRIMGRNAEIMFVSFRLNRHPEQCRALLEGETDLKMDDLSDLALAVGCELKIDIKRTHAAGRLQEEK